MKREFNFNENTNVELCEAANSFLKIANKYVAMGNAAIAMFEAGDPEVMSFLDISKDTGKAMIHEFVNDLNKAYNNGCVLMEKEIQAIDTIEKLQDNNKQLMEEVKFLRSEMKELLEEVKCLNASNKKKSTD